MTSGFRITSYAASAFRRKKCIPQVVDIGPQRVVAAVGDLAHNGPAHRARAAGEHLAIDLGVDLGECLSIAAILVTARFYVICGGSRRCVGVVRESCEAFDDVTDPRAVVEARSHRLPVLAVVDDVEAVLALAIDDFTHRALKTRAVDGDCVFRLKAEATGFQDCGIESEEFVGPGKRPDVCCQDP